MELWLEERDVEAIRRLYRQFEDVLHVCDDWLAMHKIVAELAKRPCEAPDTVRRPFERGRSPCANAYEQKPCGKCPSCRARALAEEEK